MPSPAEQDGNRSSVIVARMSLVFQTKRTPATRLSTESDAAAVHRSAPDHGERAQGNQTTREHQNEGTGHVMLGAHHQAADGRGRSCRRCETCCCSSHAAERPAGTSCGSRAGCEASRRLAHADGQRQIEPLHGRFLPRDGDQSNSTPGSSRPRRPSPVCDPRGHEPPRRMASSMNGKAWISPSQPSDRAFPVWWYR